MSYQLNAGQSYTIGVTVVNSSTQSGQPVAAVMSVSAAASAADGTVILPSQKQSYSFAAGESYKFSFPMTVPAGTGGKSGTIQASLLDPSGNQLKQASADIQITAAGVDLVSGGFTFHSVNGILFSSIDTDGYAVLAEPLILSGLNPLTVSFTFNYPGAAPDTRDIGDTLFCGLWWSVTAAYQAAFDAQAAECANETSDGNYDDYVACMAAHGYIAAMAPPFYDTYVGVPVVGTKWQNPFNMTVYINSLSNAGYGPYPTGNIWIATINVKCPGGGPSGSLVVRGIVLQ